VYFLDSPVLVNLNASLPLVVWEVTENFVSSASPSVSDVSLLHHQLTLEIKPMGEEDYPHQAFLESPISLRGI
jgi:hypothetical protein